MVGDLGRQRIPGSHIGRIGDDQVEPPLEVGRQCREQVALAPLHVQTGEGGVLPGEGEGIGADVDADDSGVWESVFQGEGETPRSGAEIHDHRPRSRHPQGRHRLLPDPLGLGAGDQGAFIDPDGDRAEVHRPLEILQRLAGAATRHQVVEPLLLFCGEVGFDHQSRGAAPRDDTAQAVEFVGGNQGEKRLGEAIVLIAPLN